MASYHITFKFKIKFKIDTQTLLHCSLMISLQLVLSLVNGRPGAMNFTQSEELQDWTRATDVRLRLLRTKTLLGHLMGKARGDETVTRRVSTCACEPTDLERCHFS